MSGFLGKALDRFVTIVEMDRRIIFLCIFISVAIPLFFPMGFPIQPSKEVVTLYEAVEALPVGSVVYLAADLDPGSMPELYPMMEAGMRHMFRKNLKVVAGCLWPAAPPLVDEAFRDIGIGEYNKTYGVDFVNLGFKEGREVVMVSLGKSIPETFPADYRGTPVGSIPMMEGIETIHDIDLIFNVSAGYPGTKEWVQQVQSRFDIRIVAGVTAVSAPEFYPYIQSGQLAGLLGGLAGAAEYEVLLRQPGSGVKGMDAQSLGHLVIVGFIIL
ncbi:MAG: hypothetical protein KJ927_03035, partial [Candidatus Eisenbacteria bacterium]|nr:hypothetical protein [Candidatus Eisenbacteria bacterium]